jgi:hypothetical protein
MKAASLTALVLLPLLLMSCSVGRRVVPQSDIEAYEVGAEAFDTKILLASRDSDFKVEVARRIGESLGDRPVYLKFIGINQLNNEDVSDYSAIIVMAKCIAWGLDPETESFLKKNPELSGIVVLITSGDGDWKPDMEGRKFDAVTSASILENADSVTEEILVKVYTIIDAEA